jgi:hypothetical protein
VVAVVREVLAISGTVRVRAAGGSMWPTILDGSLVTLVPPPNRLSVGQVILADWDGAPVLHRVVRVTGGTIVTAGDSCLDPDPPRSINDVCALATAVTDRRGTITLTGTWDHGARSLGLYLAARGRLALARGWRKTRSMIRFRTTEKQ